MQAGRPPSSFNFFLFFFSQLDGSFHPTTASNHSRKQLRPSRNPAKNVKEIEKKKRTGRGFKLLTFYCRFNIGQTIC